VPAKGNCVKVLLEVSIAGVVFVWHALTLNTFVPELFTALANREHRQLSWGEKSPIDVSQD
jgi:hypothetical protein